MKTPTFAPTQEDFSTHVTMNADLEHDPDQPSINHVNNPSAYSTL